MLKRIDNASILYHLAGILLSEEFLYPPHKLEAVELIKLLRIDCDIEDVEAWVELVREFKDKYPTCTCLECQWVEDRLKNVLHS